MVQRRGPGNLAGVDTTDFAQLLKEGRDRAGMSQARLGELVGRSASTVRAWERGSSLPGDPAVVTAIAAALGLDEAELFRATGLEPPADAPPPTIEQSLQTIAPSGLETPSGPESPSEADSEQTEETEPDTDLSPVPESGSQEEATGGRRRRRLRRPSRSTPAVAPPTPTAAGVGWQTGEVSYLEDPEQRLIYRLRWLYTAVGLLFLVIVLVWASGRTLEAIGDVLDVVKASIGG